MNKSKNPDHHILLNNLFNLFLDTNFQIEDEQLFEEWEINIDNILQKNMKLFRQLKTTTKAELNAIKHKRVKDFLLKLKKDLNSTSKGFQEMANDIFSKPKFAELQPMFRNLNDLTEKDKQSILMDAKVLEILSEIEEEYNKKINNEQ